MYFSIASILALAASANALSQLLIINDCAAPVYLTQTDSSQQTTGPTALAAGGSTTIDIRGTGNSLGVTWTTDYFSPNTPKLILGTSTSSGILYWSVSSVNGNPFYQSNFYIQTPSAGSNIDSVCGEAISPDGNVHGCADNSVLIEVGLCDLP